MINNYSSNHLPYKPKLNDGVLHTVEVIAQDNFKDNGNGHNFVNAIDVYFDIVSIVQDTNLSKLEHAMQYKLSMANTDNDFYKIKIQLTHEFADAIKANIEKKLHEVAEKLHSASGWTGLFSGLKIVAAVVLAATAIVSAPVTGGLGTACGLAAAAMLMEEGITGAIETAKLQDLAAKINNNELDDISKLNIAIDEIMTMMQYGVLGYFGKDAAKVSSLVINIMLTVGTLGASILETSALKAAINQVNKVATAAIENAVESTVKNAVTKGVETAVNTAGSQVITSISEEAIKSIAEKTAREALATAATNNLSSAAKESLSKAIQKAVTDSLKKCIGKTTEQAIVLVTKTTEDAVKKLISSLTTSLTIKVLDLITQMTNIGLQISNAAGAFDEPKEQNNGTQDEDTTPNTNWGQKATQATQMGFTAGILFMLLEVILKATDPKQEHQILSTTIETGLSLGISLGLTAYNTKKVSGFMDLKTLTSEVKDLPKPMQTLFKLLQSGKLSLVRILFNLGMTIDGTLQSGVMATMSYTNGVVRGTEQKSTAETQYHQQKLDLMAKNIDSILDQEQDAMQSLDSSIAKTMNDNRQFNKNYVHIFE